MLLLIGTEALAQETTWELRDNRWEQVNSAETTQPVADPTLDEGEQLLNQGKYKAALKILIPWIEVQQGSPVYDRGLYLMAEAYYQKGDRIRSFYYCDQLMDQYPTSILFYPALEKQYQIADAYLNGYKRRFLGIPFLHAYHEALEMMFRIQQRSPGSPLAEKALLRTADWYYADSQFDFASDAYTSYIRTYPRSPKIPEVKLRQAFSYLAQFRGLRFDATPIIDARQQLLEIQANYPELADEENVALVLSRIDDTFARKLFVTADFYKRTNEPRGAAYTYQYLIKRYPETHEASKAQAELDKLPEWARDEAAAPPPSLDEGE
jgi:outer membrane assembly lipoprotein YfiO